MLGTLREMGGRRPQPGMLERQGLLNEYEPTTGEVLGAAVEDAFQGTGTFFSDFTAQQVLKAQQQGPKLTEDQYKASAFFRPGISYTPDMTEASARQLAEYDDDQRRRAFIFEKASTAQSVAGVVTAFGAGVFEPKNFAIGAATAVVGGPIISRAVGMRRMAAAEQALGRYGSRAAIGAAENVAATALVEPSNYYSSSILQQDYGMVDTLWNLGLGAVMGGGLGAGVPYVQDRFAAHRARSQAQLVETMTHELDAATAQLVQGKTVDVSAVEKIQEGGLATKTAAEKREAIDEAIKQAMPEIAARFEAAQQSVRAKTPQFDAGEFRGNRHSDYTAPSKPMLEAMKGAVAELGDATSGARIMIERDGQGGTPDVMGYKGNLPDWFKSLNRQGENVTRAYVEKVMEKVSGHKPLGKKEVRIAEALYQAAIDWRTQNIEQYRNFKLSRWGTDNPDQIARALDTDRAAEVADAVRRAHDPDSDTALDHQAADALAAWESEHLTDAEQAAIAEYEAMQSELLAMRESGALSKGDEAAIDAAAELKENDIDAAYDAAFNCLTKD